MLKLLIKSPYPYKSYFVNGLVIDYENGITLIVNNIYDLFTKILDIDIDIGDYEDMIISFMHGRRVKFDLEFFVLNHGTDTLMSFLRKELGKKKDINW